MQTQPAAVLLGAPNQRLEFAYDYQGRRTLKRVLVWNTSTSNFELQTETQFLHDGWNLVAEFVLNTQLSTLSLARTYTWGLDVANSLQDAGGVGGLLAESEHSTLNPQLSTHSFPTYDANGNVVQCLDSSGAIAAHFDYSPFGEPIRATGTFALNATFRFSTKYADPETDLLYYGFRYYAPDTGRWLGRDPAEERGGGNLYGMVRNDPLNLIDVLGRWGATQHRAFLEHAIPPAVEVLGLKRKCRDRISGAVLDGNLGQDDPAGSLWNNARHYNRNQDQTGIAGDAAFVSYLAEERSAFEKEISNPTTAHCRRALWSIGRLSHSWQDFFMHAIRRDGLGGKENSSFPGWTAWSVGVTGDPGNRSNFWPSSFTGTNSGEHPGWGNEPVVDGSAEFAARLSAAQAYTDSQLAPLLRQWAGACKCACETSWDISWYTTELPLR